jgi:hypothetical protein
MVTVTVSLPYRFSGFHLPSRGTKLGAQFSDAPGRTYVASEHIAEIETANPHIDAWRMIPQHAWDIAQNERVLVC